MKRIVFISLLFSIILNSFSCEAQNKKASKAKITVTDKIEVFYFHYTRRCITCNAVESVTKETIAEMYPAQFKKGLITFTSVNLDEENSKTIAEKCKAEGQALLVMGKGKRFDLTDKGFMYAKNTPEKLKAEVKKTIDALL